jgi:hypothetical protein
MSGQMAGHTTVVLSWSLPFFSTKKNSTNFSKKISTKFSMIFLRKKKSYEKSDFSQFSIENLLRRFFLRKKNKKMSN